MTTGILADLSVGFSTLAARAHGIQPPAASSGAEVLVCIQGGPVPELDLGTSFTSVEVPGFGVASSRNTALDHATRPYLLFCDDDVVIDTAGVAAGIRHLRRTGKALALGRGIDPTGAMRKRYPSRAERLTLLNSAKAATYEMLVDVQQIRAHGLRFDERFGAGADLHLGDEYVFVADLLRAGLAGDAVPFIYGIHPVDSSGSRWGGAVDSHARAVAINRVFGRAATPARIAFGLKNWRKLGGPREVARFVTDGTSPPDQRDPMQSR